MPSDPFHVKPFDQVLDRCLFCDGDEFEPGPRGGAARNIACAGCGARYNVLEHPRLPRLLVGILSGPDDPDGYVRFLCQWI